MPIFSNAQIREQLAANGQAVPAHVLDAVADVADGYELASVRTVNSPIVVEFVLRTVDRIPFIGPKTPEISVGNQIVDSFRHSFNELNAVTVMFNGRIYTAKDEWTENQSPATGVTVRFKQLGVFNGLNTKLDSTSDTLNTAVDSTIAAYDSLAGLASFMRFLMQPGIWVRVGVALLGAALLAVAVARMTGAGELLLPPGLKIVKSVL